jgi:hypothetical protein
MHRNTDLHTDNVRSDVLDVTVIAGVARSMQHPLSSLHLAAQFEAFSMLCGLQDDPPP